MDVWHHFIKEHTKLGNIIFQYTPTTENVADILTKTLPKDTLHKFVCRMYHKRSLTCFVMNWI